MKLNLELVDHLLCRLYSISDFNTIKAYNFENQSVPYSMNSWYRNILKTVVQSIQMSWSVVYVGCSLKGCEMAILTYLTVLHPQKSFFFVTGRIWDVPSITSYFCWKCLLSESWSGKRNVSKGVIIQHDHHHQKKIR